MGAAVGAVTGTDNRSQREPPKELSLGKATRAAQARRRAEILPGPKMRGAYEGNGQTARSVANLAETSPRVIALFCGGGDVPLGKATCS